MSGDVNQLTLHVEVPICAFRPHESREYQDTYPFPPPSAVYGMLLSLCGVQRAEKLQHRGVHMALAIETLPGRSKVFRKLRRGKELSSIRPDYQDLLVGVKLWIWLGTGEDSAEEKLVNKIVTALESPDKISRSGGLSLGESSYLVDSISRKTPDDKQVMHFLKPDEEGFYNLPVWIDHHANTNNRQRFSIVELPVSEGIATCTINVQPSTEMLNTK